MWLQAEACYLLHAVYSFQSHDHSGQKRESAAGVRGRQASVAPLARRVRATDLRSEGGRWFFLAALLLGNVTLDAALTHTCGARETLSHLGRVALATAVPAGKASPFLALKGEDETSAALRSCRATEK